MLADGGAKLSMRRAGVSGSCHYPIGHKNTGFYQLFEFRADTQQIVTLETEYRRDEQVLRFLTIALDKHAVDYNDRKRKD